MYKVVYSCIEIALGGRKYRKCVRTWYPRETANGGVWGWDELRVSRMRFTRGWGGWNIWKLYSKMV